MTALLVDGVRAGYGAREVLRGIDLRVEGGTLVAVVGPNGSGKTTLLRCCAGLVRPTAGRILLGGRDMRELDRAQIARRVAVVPQSVETLFPFSVREIVALGRVARLGPFARPSAADRGAIERALDELDLGSLADRRIDELSGGERQRAVVAMALAQEAGVLLLDEPTVHLDPSHQRSLGELIRGLARSRGVAVVMVIHDLNLGATLADRVIVVNAGRVVADGRPLDVLTAANVEPVFGPGLWVGERDGIPFVLPHR